MYSLGVDSGVSYFLIVGTDFMPTAATSSGFLNWGVGPWSFSKVGRRCGLICV
jgi:hypothetical protein